MKYSFTCYGHENITATHPTTLMFTKDEFVTKRGDCIVGCGCDFKTEDLKNFLKKCQGEIALQIAIEGHTEMIKGTLNKKFNCEGEIVLRKSDFLSERTLLTMATKSAHELSEKIRTSLKNGIKVDITLSLR